MALLMTRAFRSRFIAGCNLLSLRPNEGVVELRERIECGSLGAVLLRFRTVAFAFIRLVQAIHVLRVLLVGLL